MSQEAGTSQASTRLGQTFERIAEACSEVGRDPRTVTLIAVSKTFGVEHITPVIAAGQRHFGENRVQEALGKWPPLIDAHADIVLHLIGPLQSNKAREAVQVFDVIHTVDRPKIAQALKSEILRQGRNPELFVQVNTGEEPQKAGVAPGEVAALLAVCRDSLGLEIAGLMCIPPANDAPAPHFALLAKLAAEHRLAKLSMGMSADFETAVQFGASYVRVGSAIFGSRA
ncbi:MAG: YggS family pyridoxal phosphate-dependent enzyme [Hyphomicrobiaceae bacterium]